jgi:hypothetical protein
MNISLRSESKDDDVNVSDIMIKTCKSLHHFFDNKVEETLKDIQEKTNLTLEELIYKVKSNDSKKEIFYAHPLLA